MTTSRFADHPSSRTTARLLLAVVVALALTALAPLATHTTADAARAGGTFTVNKRACPDRIDAHRAAFEQLARACTEPMDGVGFLLGTHVGTQMVWSKQNTGDVLPSAVVWSGVAPGSILLAEQIPPGYGPPVVFCRPATQSDPGTMIKMSLSFSLTLVYQLPAGRDLVCDWFNVGSTDKFSPNKS